ncbi:hypothetical protein GE300_08840 [Rhodobacteraceae bacterium 2CG4]|uniref:Uncharacterized protein n=1 Tax=Halovulum marinum TaxID=2662447 RepID=A0A6L5YZK8_9RHOB|nr:hypothetical protein [Halovulum marinum]MSU89723.1 hypothetical protein [Halovulum marinum]
MTKHVIDTPKKRAEGARARHFAEIVRQTGAAGPHATTLALQRRAKGAYRPGLRAAAFARIERGLEA